MNLNIKLRNLLPFLLLLLMILIIIPQSFASEEIGDVVIDDSSDNSKAISQVISESSDSDKQIADLRSSDDDFKSNSEKTIKASPYDYVSSPSQNAIVYTKGENKNITVTIDANRDNLEKMEGEPFYVWVNGEGEDNKVSVYNIFADVEEFNYDLKLISNKLVSGFNNLTFHPNAALLNSAGFSNNKYDILTVYYIDPDSGSGDINGSDDNGTDNGTSDDKNNGLVYISTPTVSNIDYTIGTNKNITVIIEYNVSESSKFEFNKFYAWINGESNSNAVELTNVDATVSVLNLDLKSLENYLIDGNNTLTFHPSISVLEGASFYNHTFNQLTINAKKPVVGDTSLTVESVSDDGTINIKLSDYLEKGIPSGKIKYLVNGSEMGSLTTDNNGRANLKLNSTGLIDLALVYEGNLTNNPSNYSIKVINTEKIVNNTIEINNTVYVNVTKNRTATKIQYQDMVTDSVIIAVDGRVGKYFEVNLTDIDGNPLANKDIKIGFNGKVYNKTTNATGGARLQINLAAKFTYTFAIGFIGDDDYMGSFEVAKITVNPQKPKLASSNKSYKASAKTKSLTATFKTKLGNPVSGKTIKFTVNGKTYTAKTNSKGVATVKVSLNKKGTYSFTAKFAGDNRFAAISVSKKLTIK